MPGWLSLTWRRPALRAATGGCVGISSFAITREGSYRERFASAVHHHGGTHSTTASAITARPIMTIQWRGKRRRFILELPFLLA